MILKVVPRDDGITQVNLTGKLDGPGMRMIDARFHAATVAAARPTIVDLSGVDSITSLGLGMLFSCARALHGKGARLALLRPQPLVERVLRTAQIHNLIPIFTDAVEAETFVSAP